MGKMKQILILAEEGNEWAIKLKNALTTKSVETQDNDFTPEMLSGEEYRTAIIAECPHLNELINQRPPTHYERLSTLKLSKTH